MDGHRHAECRTAAQGHGPRRLSPFGRLFRLIGWWYGFTGLYTMFTVCPCCGQQVCPVGLGIAGTVGAFLTLCVQDWRRFFRFLMHKLGRKEKGYDNA
jgi:hypothetical protein